MKLQQWGGIAKIGLLAGCVALVVSNAYAAKKMDGNLLERNVPLDNVIIMIPDGCDETVQTVARWYKGEDLAVDKLQNGAVKTHMADSIITDSAAAATAFATGHKTSDGFIGLGPRTDTLLDGFDATAAPYAPVASILEAARMAGKAIGIVSTSRVTHATPAAFAAHTESRNLENEIMEHMVYNNVDVVFGGGARHLIPDGEAYTTSFGDTWSGKRTDGEDLLAVLEERGYQFIDSKEQMSGVTSGKVWGLFDDSHMQPDIDRHRLAEHEPSLAEMVAKAIEILSQDPDGFVLMVEGSQVDWAGHNNDPIYMVTDFLAFDDAVKIAADFAETNGRTAVLAYADHNTGGMKVGHYYTAVGYTKTKIGDLVDPLRGMTMTANGVVAMMVNDTDAALINSVTDNWGIVLSAEDIADIRELEKTVGLSYALARIVSTYHTVIGWTTHGHTGETVPFWATTNFGAPANVIDNTDLAKIAAEVIGVDLKKTTNKLYVDLNEENVDYSVDTTDPENTVVKIGDWELPVNKDYMVKTLEKDKNRRTVVKTVTVQLPGLTVYAPATDKVYLSKMALRKLNNLR